MNLPNKLTLTRIILVPVFMIFVSLTSVGGIADGTFQPVYYLIAGIVYFCGNGFRHVLDYAAFIALVGILFGVVYLIYLNKIHEKEIATKIQKNLSFGMTVYSGLAGAVIGILQFVLDAGASSELVWITVGGVLNFVAGLPIFLSFKKGIFYGVQ